MQKSITHKPIFWFLFGLISLGGIFFAYHFFDKAFPITNLDITMDRHQALQKATELARQYNWGPENYQQTASFGVDSEVQNYIELEQGGPKAFAEVLKEEYLSPYTWEVRLFKQFDPLETWIYFTPQGTPYGFKQIIPENYSSPSLSMDEALEFAKNRASTDWHIDFAQYNLVEKSHDSKPNGRIDYTFVYEHAHKKMGDAPYRLTIEVSGSSFSKLILSLQIPEAFKRKYQEMRSANNTIALVANVAMALLYLLGGCLIGLYILVGAEWTIWKNAFFAAFILALLSTAHSINTLPLEWIGYDTALSINSFLGSFLLRIIVQFIFIIAAYSVIIAAAESLTRKAFPKQLQFWKLWNTDVAASVSVLGRTLGSYLILGFDFAFATGLYYLASTYCGWWSPSESLYSPNTLATYIPWISPIAQSVNAGFIEECLFRAIPLASAVLLGKRFGKTRLWIIAAFIIQAIIFGAAHANYPAQPAYARLVELLIPSFVFGGLYFIFGLMPAIVSHILYDIVWFSLPIFVSHSSGIWLDKLVIIALSLLPLAIVLIARLKKGAWIFLHADTYNQAWKPKEGKEKPIVPIYHYPEKSIGKRTTYSLFALGTVGFISWILFTRFNDYSFHLELSRKEAIDQSCNIVKNIYSSNECWDLLSYVESNPLEQHIFVWRTSGKEVFHQMVGTYLTPPVWKVRFVKFTGDIAHRAEEYQINLSGHGTLYRSTHILPEATAGAQLSKEEARVIAFQGLKDRFDIVAENVEEISAQSSKKPDRIDWAFIFKDKSIHALKNGDPRIQIIITGNTVTDANRYIFIPEDWLRNFKHEQTIKIILMLICSLLMMGILAGLCVVFIKNWHQISFSFALFGIITVILLTKSSIQMVNLWPIFQALFQTSQPYYNQAISIIGSMSVQIIFKALLWGCLAGIIHGWKFKTLTSTMPISMRLALGISAGLFIAGCCAFAQHLILLLKPEWVDYISAGAYHPFVSIGLIALTDFIEATISMLFIFLIFDLLSEGWHSRKSLTILISIIGGIAMAGKYALDTTSTIYWIALGSSAGLVSILLYVLLIRMDRSRIPIIVGTIMILNNIRFALINAYPDARAGAVFSILLIAIFSWWWAHCIRDNDTK